MTSRISELFEIVEYLESDSTVYHLNNPAEIGNRIKQVTKDLGKDITPEEMCFIAYWTGNHHATKHSHQSHWDGGNF